MSVPFRSVAGAEPRAPSTRDVLPDAGGDGVRDVGGVGQGPSGGLRERMARFRLLARSSPQ